jgi:hypothetical protein
MSMIKSIVTIRLMNRNMRIVDKSVTKPSIVNIQINVPVKNETRWLEMVIGISSFSLNIGFKWFIPSSRGSLNPSNEDKSKLQ